MPPLVSAVIVVVPAAAPCAMPVGLIVATLLFEEDHRTLSFSSGSDARTALVRR